MIDLPKPNRRVRETALRLDLRPLGDKKSQLDRWRYHKWMLIFLKDTYQC